MILHPMLIAAAMLAACTALTESAPPVQRPIDLVRRLVVTTVAVNGVDSLTFILDSGAGGTAIDSSAAERIGLIVDGTTTSTGAGGSIPARWSAGNTVAFGSVVLPAITLTIIPLGSMSTALGRRIDGVIGYELFSRYVVEHDFDDMTMRIHAADRYVADGTDTALDITIAPNRLIYTTSTFTMADGRVMRLLTVLDSGSMRHTSVYSDAVARYGLIDPAKTYPEVTERGSDDKPFVSALDTLASYRIGPFEHLRPPVVLMRGTPNTVASPAHPIEALLGQGILLDYHIVYDYMRRKVYLRPRQIDGTSRLPSGM